MQVLAPFLEFHQKSKGISRDDVRIYWDVHVLRGENEFFARSKGSSVIPGMLGPKQKAHSPAAMQQEVLQKIGQPLISACMIECEAQNSEVLQLLANSGMTDTPAHSIDGGDQMAKLAAQAAEAADADRDEEEVDEA
jgi:hypothetical protein